MIFVTVGHQMPFDRLIRAVDEWAAANARTDVFAQIGRSAYQPKNMQARAFLSPAEFEQKMNEASAVVAHAGTGTIIAALQSGKPLLVMPRQSRLGETRNDHQISTARHFTEAGYLLAAADEIELTRCLRQLETFRPAKSISESASSDLIARLRTFIFESR